MRAFIISIAILIIIITSSIIYVNQINKTTSEIIMSMEKLDNAVKKNDWEYAEKQLDSIQNSWKGTEKWMTALINHSEIDSIRISLARLSQYVHFKNTTEYMAESDVVKFLIRHFSTKEKINISNLL